MMKDNDMVYDEKRYLSEEERNEFLKQVDAFGDKIEKQRAELEEASKKLKELCERFRKEREAIQKRRQQRSNEEYR